jgi:uncharacterized membrane protein YcaP (DUF421 family)
MMKPEDYQAFDFGRMLIGKFPASVYFEAILRTLVMYAFTVFITRAIGKRVKNELSFPEMMIVILFGPVGGTPMFDPGVPLLLGLMIITLLVGLERLLAFFVRINNSAYRIIEGKPELVIKEGIIQPETLKRQEYSNQELLMNLRKEGIENLGELKKVFLEPSGELSVFKFKEGESKEGLSIIPGNENFIKKGETVSENGRYVCGECGNLISLNEGENCPKCQNCHCEKWAKARKN